MLPSGVSHAATSQILLVESLTALSEELDETLFSAEKAILNYHTAQFQAWLESEKNALNQIHELDYKACESRTLLCKISVDRVEGDMDKRISDRKKEREAVAGSVAAEHMAFFEEGLAAVVETRAEQVREVVGKITRQWKELRQSRKEIMWEQLDVALQEVDFSCSEVGANLHESGEQLFAAGELLPHLQAEGCGWKRSQMQDAERLLQRISQETDGSITSLAEGRMKLSHGTAPTVKLMQSGVTERPRLDAIQEDVLTFYEPKFNALLINFVDQHEAYERELEQMLLQALHERMRMDSCVQHMKAALCCWRLDYQQVYHVCYKGLISDRAAVQHNISEVNSIQRTCCSDLDTLRSLACSLWDEHRVPVLEIRSFLNNAVDAAAVDCAENIDGLVQVYEEELRRYGVLSLLSQVNQHELLESWLQTQSLMPKLFGG